MNEIRELLPNHILEIVLDIYQVAIRYTFMALTGMALCCFLSSLFIQHFDLQTKVRK